MLRGVPHPVILVLCMTISLLVGCEPTAPPFSSDSVPTRNACGGWAPEEFRAKPGDACGECGRGHFVCQGEDALVCVGDWTNECGGCAPLDVQIGSDCGVCDGDWSCSDDGEAAVCMGGEANACGGCVELANEPGDVCGDCGDGKYLCVPETGRLQCDEPPRNACGGCSDLDGSPGASCGECGAGTLDCAADRESLECVQGELELNACGGCVALTVEVGNSCGTCGTWTCAGINAVDCHENGREQCGFVDADGDGWGTDEYWCSCDGTGVASARGDCDDDDATTFPICGNGVLDCGDEVACQFQPDVASATIISPVTGVDTQPGLRAPFSVDADVTGDGTHDLVIAMPNGVCGPDDSACGSAVVIAGPLRETKLSRPLSRPLDEGTTFGDCVSVGDFDGDGANDIAITGTAGDVAQAHFFMGPIADHRLLQPDSADYVVNALRTLPLGGELIACHAAAGADGRASLLLSFDAEPYVQVAEYDGIVDDIEWARGDRRRHVADVQRTDEGDIVYVVSTGTDQVDVEEWQDLRPFSRPTFLGARTVQVGDVSGRMRARVVEMDVGTGLIVSSPRTGVGVYTESNRGWPNLPDLTMLGLRVAPDDGWPIAGGFDLDGDGELEFAVGNPSVSSTGEVMWSPLWEHFVGWRPTIYPSDMIHFAIEPGHSGVGVWIDGRGDLNGDGERDFAVLESGTQAATPQVLIFFSREGY